jgi:hypothetical protein
MKFPKKIVRFIGLLLAAATCTAVCCVAMSACFLLVFYWACGEVLARQQGLVGLRIGCDALTYALIADGAGLSILAVLVVGGPVLTIAFGTLIRRYAERRAAREA